MVNTKNDNSDFPKLVLEYSICDVLELTETFLNENESLQVPGYKLYGNNRNESTRMRYEDQAVLEI